MNVSYERSGTGTRLLVVKLGRLYFRMHLMLPSLLSWISFFAQFYYLHDIIYNWFILEYGFRNNHLQTKLKDLSLFSGTDCEDYRCLWCDAVLRSGN